MATTSYIWSTINTLDLGLSAGISGKTAVASRYSGGSFLVGGTAPGGVDFVELSTAGAITTAFAGLGVSNVAVANLFAGPWVAVGQDSDSIVYEVFSSLGVSKGPIDLGRTNATNADVTNVGSAGFYIASQRLVSSLFGSIDHYNIELVHVPSANNYTPGATITVDSSLANDINPSITSFLAGSKIAVAWSRIVGNATQLWVAVYNLNGSVAVAPKLVDSTGTINANVKLAPLSNGGFAAVYEDNGWSTGGTDITYLSFDANANVVSSANISNPGLGIDGSQDRNPAIASLNNGMVAISWDNNLYSDTDTYLALVNASTGQRLATTGVPFGQSIAKDIQFSAIAADPFGTHNVLVTADNASDGRGVAATLQPVYQVTGDGTDETLNGLYQLANRIDGMGGKDRLNGGNSDDILIGGAGDDDLYGSGGSDTADYSGSSAKVKVSLSLTGRQDTGTATGKDLLNSIENLVGSAFTDKLIGNGYANILSGGAGDDILDGKDNLLEGVNWRGDTLRGGSGNDTYIVGAYEDIWRTKIVELVDEGIDTVQSASSLILAANVEKLILTGTDNLSGKGNELDNTLTGNAGNNMLYGFDGKDTLSGGAGNDELHGGAHADVLQGGAGADRFYFEMLGVRADRDSISDFEHGIDQIWISGTAFAALKPLGSGQLQAQYFVTGTAAKDADDRLIYDNKTGALYYDPDGNGAAAPLLFAVLAHKEQLSASDIWLF